MIKVTFENTETGETLNAVEGEVAAGFARTEEATKIFLCGDTTPLEVLEGMADTMVQLGKFMMKLEEDYEMDTLHKLLKKLLKRAMKREAEKDE